MQAAPIRAGVPSLRSALRRARKAGASVEFVSSTGEVRVRYGPTVLTINARRKDSTRELVALVVAAEANPLPPGTPNAPLRLPLGPIVSPPPRPEPHPDNRPNPYERKGVRIEKYVRANSPPDAEGWRRYDAPGIARALGLPGSTNVSTWAHYANRNGRIDWRRPSGPKGRITHIRFADERPEVGGPMPPRPVAVPVAAVTPTRGHAVPAADPIAPAGTLPTPHLAEYAEARRVAHDNPYLRVEPGPDALDEILGEAVRLYWWVRRGLGS